MTSTTTASDFNAPPPHRSKSALKTVFLTIVWILIAIYFLIAILLLAVRLFFLPLVESEKPYIEEKLTEYIHYPVKIGAIKGSWQLFNPGIDIEDITIGGDDGIKVGRVSALLSLLTFVRFEPIFSSLVIENPSATIYRDGPMRFTFMGQEIDLEKQSSSDSNETLWKVLNLISHQKQIELYGGVFRTVDQANNQSFEITDIKAAIVNSTLTKRAALELTFPKEIADPIDIRAKLTPSNPLKITNIASWNGEFYLNTQKIDFTEVAKWVPDFNVKYRGVGSGSIWLDTVEWMPTEATFIGALSNVHLQLEPSLKPLEITYLTGKLQGEIKGHTYSLSTEDLALQLASGTKVPDLDTSISLTFNNDDQLLSGSIKGNEINLGVIEELFPSLPIAQNFKDFVIQRKLSGILYNIAAQWDGSPDRPLTYEGSLSFKQLSSASYTPVDASDKLWLPGFRNLTGSAKFNPKGGEVVLNSPNSGLSIPKVFPVASYNFEKFILNADWNLENKISVKIKDFQLENPDLAANANGEYIVDGSPLGYLNAHADIQRIEAASVWKFVPLIVGKEALTWFHYGLLKGSGSGQADFKGPINAYPFRDSSEDKFIAKFNGHNIALDFFPIQMTQPTKKRNPGAVWPTVSQIDGTLTIQGDDLSAEVVAGKYRDVLIAKGVLSLPAMMVQPLTLTVDGMADGALESYIKFINDSPLRTLTGNIFGKAVATGNGTFHVNLSVPIVAKPDIKVNGTFAVENVGLNLNQFDIPNLPNITGKINFSEKGASSANLKGKTFGQTVGRSFDVNEKGAVTFKANGFVTPPLLQFVVPVDMLKPMIGNYLAGTTPFNLSGSLNAGKFKLDASSPLTGMQIKLPAPFTKAAGPAQPFTLALTDEKGTSDVSIKLGNQLSGRMIIRNGNVASAAFGMAQTPPMPNRGYAIDFSTPVISVAAWEKVFGADNSKKSKGKSAPLSLPVIASMNVKIGELQIENFNQKDFVLTGNTTPTGWTANISSNQLQGTVDWANASVERSKEGRLTVNLSHLYLPDTLKMTAEQSKPLDISSGWPALNVTIGDLTYGKLRPGRVEFSARNTVSGKGHLWEILKLHVTNPDNSLVSSGSWQKGYDGSNLTTLLVDDKISNLGGLLNRFDMKNLVKAGKGTIKGELSWDGTPIGFNFASFDGNLNISLSKGEILKIEPGAGAKLLTLLSLQSLTRFLTLDFRDFWSKGFNFDSITGGANIDDGVMAIKDLTLVGSGATVVTNGTVNMKKETENLKILILPDVSSAGASIALAIANPVVGLGSFLAQLVFKDPLSKIFSFTYSVTGTWSNPVVKKL
ncbi:MAG: TIGR02099 family protein [Burkholderiales bacterium]|nr:TIGR02099 family protein [Burkholderiales bacterium]